MDKIFEYLKDPSWWFTTVFIGAIASLLGGFLNAWLSRISSRYSRWRVKKREQKEAEIQLILSNETLLAVEMQRCLFHWVVYLFLQGVFLGSYFLCHSHESGEWKPLRVFGSQKGMKIIRRDLPAGRQAPVLLVENVTLPGRTAVPSVL